MLIKHRKSWELRESDVTPEAMYRNRREVLKTMGVATAGLSMAAVSSAVSPALAKGDPLTGYAIGENTTGEELTPYEAVTTYNNFYEFGTGKDDPAKYADPLTIDPWSITVEGQVDNPGTYALEDLIPFNALEERIYRLRCVEAWSMVVPWVGVPLADIISKLQPNSKAKYIAFTTHANKDEMRGLRRRVLNWPYIEGLRLDEAMNPLTLMAVGLYGEKLPKQNGAPVRLVVPWKYGFKSIKSIAKIEFLEYQPPTSWELSAPNEYGFYSNVNPEVDHPRWSQSSERRIGEFFRRKTLMFNGYADEVSHLYAGMDLQKQF